MKAMALLCLLLAPWAWSEEAHTVTLNDIHLRDPFILPVPEEGRYYLYGTGWRLPGGPGFMVYTSTDLKNWEGPKAAFTRPADFESSNFWAPEVHRYQGKYILFGTFMPKTPGACRGTWAMSSDRPEGPFHLLSREPVTPKDWFCLDGTLFVDDEGAPWMVFCHEWVQVKDGEMCALRLSPDLSKGIGEPVLLFKASEAPWGRGPLTEQDNSRVTDGPFLHRTAEGALLMIWSSFGTGGYKVGVVKSETGKITGPWKQIATPVFEKDGGHGMLFRSLDGRLMMTFHQPNKGPLERPKLFEVTEQKDTLTVQPWPQG